MYACTTSRVAKLMTCSPGLARVLSTRGVHNVVSSGQISLVRCQFNSNRKNRNYINSNSAAQVFRQQIRCSSQLYPTTSHQFEAIMDRALQVVGNTDSYSTLRQYIRGEFTSITKYLSKLIGTNHPMLETAKRCSYIAEGRMGSAQARGLVVMLTAKALSAGDAPTASPHQQQQQQTQTTSDRNNNSRSSNSAELMLKRQLSLAEMTEMTYSAYMIHRGVMDVRQHYEYGDADDAQRAKGVHYGNKVAILCGDFLLAYVMRGLGDLYNSRVVDCIATAITEFMEGEFLLIEDHQTRQYFRTTHATDVTRWQARAFASIGSLQANSCRAAALLTGVPEPLANDAYEFGKNLGLAWQTHTELVPFLSSTYEPVQLPEMPPYPAFDLNCLPVIMHVRRLADNNSLEQFINDIYQTDHATSTTMFSNNVQQPNTQAANNNSKRLQMIQHSHQDRVHYERLHSIMVNDGRAIRDTQMSIRQYSQAAVQRLAKFPRNEARDVLENICHSLNIVDN